MVGGGEEKKGKEERSFRAGYGTTQYFIHNTTQYSTVAVVSRSEWSMVNGDGEL